MGRLCRMVGSNVGEVHQPRTLDDVAMVKKLFNTVPERYLPVIAGIEQFCDIDMMLFEKELSRLMVFDESTRQRQGVGGGVTAGGQLLLTIKPNGKLGKRWR